MAEMPQTGFSQSSTRRKAGSGTGSSDEALPVLFISAPTSLASDLDGMPDLELDTSDYGGHLATSSESSRVTEPVEAAWPPYGPVPSRSASSLTSRSADWSLLERDGLTGGGHLELSSGSSSGHLTLSSSGHLDISSSSGSGRLSPIPSRGATPQATPVQEAEDVLEQVYKMAERTISAAYWDHDKFKSGYYEVKEAMTDAGRVDVARLGNLLAREEEAIRSAYGRSKWQSLNMDYGVDAYTASRIHGARNSTLAWIKSEQKSMGLPSKKGSMARLKSWASNKFSKKVGKPEVPRHLMEAIAEDDEAA
ncbi:MAG TPA: hypothetical protein VFL86_00760 [Burkholderiaceae bacterium]|nr:hypothetical protein [Burkholderiaceae bacterium]